MLAIKMEIKYSSQFNKRYQKTPNHIKVAFKEALEIFFENPNNSLLRNHMLREKFAGYRNIVVLMLQEIGEQYIKKRNQNQKM